MPLLNRSLGLALFPFVFVACTHHQVVNVKSPHSPFNSQVEQVLKQDMKILNKMSQQHGLASFVQATQFLDYSEANCREDQIACTFPRQAPATIFLTPKYFKLGWLSRVSTLLHESHHLLKPTQHHLCKGYECDPYGDTPYGAEFQLMQSLLDKSSNHKNIQKNAQTLINKLKNHLY